MFLLHIQLLKFRVRPTRKQHDEVRQPPEEAPNVVVPISRQNGLSARFRGSGYVVRQRRRDFDLERASVADCEPKDSTDDHYVPEVGSKESRIVKNR